MEYERCNGCPYYSPNTECTASYYERVYSRCESPLDDDDDFIVAELETSNGVTIFIEVDEEVDELLDFIPMLTTSDEINDLRRNFMKYVKMYYIVNGTPNNVNDTKTLLVRLLNKFLNEHYNSF